MIAKMKKVTVLVSSINIEEALNELRKAGLLHIKHISKSEGEETVDIEKKIEAIDKAQDIISRFQPEKQSAEIKDKNNYINEVKDISEHINRISQRKENVEKEIQRMEKWGDFDPHAISELHENEVFLKLYVCKNKHLDKLPQDKLIQKVSEDENNSYLVFITDKEDDKLDLPEVGLPSQSLSSFKRELDQLKKKEASLNKRLEELSECRQDLIRYRDSMEKKLEFYQAKNGMGKEEGFSYLQGFGPIKDLKRLNSLVEKNSWALLAEEPESPEETPTLIRNPKWIEIIKPVFDFMGTVPGYNEYDISFWFLIFFSLFFAMLVGDAGYGMLFLIATFFFHRKSSKSVSKKPFFLMYVLSGATVLWGTITGTWFGAEQIGRMPFLNYFVIDKIDSFATSNNEFIMYLCFIIGIVQLTIGHCKVLFRYINSLFALSQVGWISILWGLFFTARYLILGIPFPEYGFYLLGAGAFLVVFFSSPQKNILKGALRGLSDLPLSTINSFSDIISYIRLFAVGYATVAVASNFNAMALGIGGGNVLKGLAAALILFFGHSLNIVLALMAVIVHGIRLNLLEFSNHLNMQWSGYKYKPFSE